MTTSDTLDAIFGGKVDDGLSEIVEACRERQEQIAARLKFELKKGDTFEMVGDVHPGYLLGMQFIVEKVNTKTVEGKPVEPAKARRYRNGIRAHLTSVKKV